MRYTNLLTYLYLDRPIEILMLIKDVKLELFHNRSSNRYNRLKPVTVSVCAVANYAEAAGTVNRQILLRETYSISIVVGIRSPPLHSVACLCSRGSQVAIEYGLGRRIRGDTGRYKLQ